MSRKNILIIFCHGNHSMSNGQLKWTAVQIKFLAKSECFSTQMKGNGMLKTNMIKIFMI